jgi:hypothetical protein
MFIFGGPFSRSLMVLGVVGALAGAYFGLKGAITAKHAEDSVNRKGGDSKSMFHAARLETGLDKVRAKVGNDGQLLSLDVFPGYLVVNAATGSENKGRTFRIQDDGDVQELPVNLVGPGKLKDNVFPIDKIDPKVVEKVATQTAAKEHVGGLDGVTHIVVGLAPGSGDAGIAVYTNNDQFWRAALDGSGLSNPATQAKATLADAEKTASAVESQTSAAASSASSITTCITSAGTDAAKIAACTK